MTDKKDKKIKETKEKIDFIKKMLEDKEVCKQVAYRLTDYIKSSKI